MTALWITSIACCSDQQRLPNGHGYLLKYLILAQEVRGLPHFGALHAKLGLLTAALSTASAIGGALAFGKTGLLQLFPAHVQPKIKAAHRTVGGASVHLPQSDMLGVTEVNPQAFTNGCLAADHGLSAMHSS